MQLQQARHEVATGLPTHRARVEQHHRMGEVRQRQRLGERLAVGDLRLMSCRHEFGGRASRETSGPAQIHVAVAHSVSSTS